MVVVDGKGVPLGSQLASASPAEVRLAESTLDAILIQDGVPQRLILDRGYDSDRLRVRCWERGIEMTCPHRRGRKRMLLQDGRPLRRYRRRWILERTFAWLGAFHRLVVRYDDDILSYQAFFHVACLLITLRAL